MRVMFEIEPPNNLTRQILVLVVLQQSTTNWVAYTTKMYCLIVLEALSPI